MTEQTEHQNAARYTAIAILLHWVIAFAIIGMIFVGWNMHDNEALYQLHKSIGITILTLTIARIAWRLFNAPPPEPAGMAWWEKALSGLVHLGFYGLMLAMPLSGWLLVSTSYEFDIPTVLFGVVSWPDFPGSAALANEEGHELMQSAHSILPWIAFGLLGLHVLGAVKHDLLDKEGVIKRMIPGLFGRTSGVNAPARGGLIAFGAALVFFAAFAAVPLATTGFASASGGETLDAPADWIVDADASEIAFTGVNNGNPFRGTFGAWTAAIVFDPTQLDKARASVVVETGTADARTKRYNDTLRLGEWFDVANFPTTSVELTNFRRASGRRAYTADATITMKGVGVTVPFDFTVEIENGRAVMTGSTSLSRAALNLGQLSDAAGNWVADDVGIEVTVEADRAG